MNEENSQDCADFEARFCCPELTDGNEGLGNKFIFEKYFIISGNETKYVMDGTCDDPDYLWTNWLNTNSPVNSTGTV